jgi:hypothetical protein
MRPGQSLRMSGWRLCAGAYEWVMAAKKTRKRKQASTPWERPAPRKTRHTSLSSADKNEAKQRAKKAGRPYPNLVDNMTVAKEKKAGRKTAGRKTAAKRKHGAKKKGRAKKKD